MYNNSIRNMVEKFDQDSLEDKLFIIEKALTEQRSLKRDGLPIIGIVLATHNRIGYLLTYMYSLLLQQGVRVKIYISDDCSQDQTAQLFEVLQEKYPETIYYHYNSKSVGPSINRKIALKQVREEYLIFSDDDDYYINSLFLKDSIDLIRNDMNSISICFANSIVLDTASGVEEPVILDYLGSSTRDVFLNLLFAMRKPPSTFLMVFKLTKELKEELLAMEMLNDVSIYLLVLDHFMGYVGGSKTISGIYREHDANITKKLNLDFMLDNFIQQMKIVQKSSLSQLEKSKLIGQQNNVNIEYYLSNSLTTRDDRNKLYKILEDNGYQVSLWEKFKNYIRYSL